MLAFLKNRATYETIIRYLLGLSMLPYGLTKILRTQFIVLPFYTWLEPLKDIPGVTLAWAFLGYSSWFTVMLGILEVIPSILLLFRRTKLLGAILLFPVLLNIFLINIALDLWLNTQIISAILVLMNIALLLFHYQLIKEVFKRILNHLSFTEKKFKLEALANMILIGMVIFFSINELKGYISQRNFLTGDWYNKRPDYWIVKAEDQKRIDLADESQFRYYFQPYEEAYVMIPGRKEPITKKYKLDEQNQMLSIFDKNNLNSLMKGSYRIIDENTVEWNINNGKSKLLLVRKKIE